MEDYDSLAPILQIILDSEFQRYLGVLVLHHSGSLNLKLLNLKYTYIEFYYIKPSKLRFLVVC